MDMDTTATDTTAADVRKVVSYCRTTIPGEVGQRHLDEQAADLEAEAVFHGWTIVGRHDDLGQRGDTLDRPGLNAALGALAERQADALLACDTTRLASSATALMLLSDLAATQRWQILTPQPPPSSATKPTNATDAAAGRAVA